MSEKNNYLIQIIEKVKPEKIIDIVNSQPKTIKKKKFSNRLYTFLLSCLIAGSPTYSIYLLIFHLHDNPNIIEAIIFCVGTILISTALAGLLISIFEFIKTIFKNKNKEILSFHKI